MQDSGKYGSYAMNAAELAAFCEEADQAVLSTLRKTGSPLGIALGFHYDGDFFYVTIGKDRAGPKRMRNDARVCLTIPSREPYPTQFVIAEGQAEEIDDVDHAISRKVMFHGGREKWAARRVDPDRFFQSWVAVGRSVWRIRVTRLMTYDGTKTPKGEKYSVGTRMPTDTTPT